MGGYSCGEAGADGRLRNGPISTKAFQRWLQEQGIDPGPIDGRWGAQTNSGLQRFLRCYSSNVLSELSTMPIDGIIGKVTATKVQKFLAAEGFNPGPEDGIFGNMTAAAFQRYLIAQGYSCGEAGADGSLRDGPISTKAFQRWLQNQGVDPGPIDGRWGAQANCGLQCFLLKVPNCWMNGHCTLPQRYQPYEKGDVERLALARATFICDTWVEGHTFFFVLASKLKSSTGPLLPFQDLQETDWLVKSRVSMRDVVEGSMRSAAAVSHVWLTREHPDPEGEQAEVIREFLHKRPEIEKVWIDWCCLPQGNKSEAEKAFFSQSLEVVNLVYLALGVIIVLDSSYMARFWPQFEAFLSFQKVDASGLTPLPPHSSRNAVLCTGLAAQSPESVDRLTRELVSRWGRVTVTKALTNLSMNDVLVTNTRDKDLQLQKLRELQDHVVQIVEQLSVSLQ